MKEIFGSLLGRVLEEDLIMTNLTAKFRCIASHICLVVVAHAFLVFSVGYAQECPPLYTFTGESDGNNFGHSVSGAGDVNGDGYDDVIVGEFGDPYAWGSTWPGQAYVYSGQSGTLLWTFTGEAINDFFGFSVSGAGDVNCDDYDDVIVGAYLNDAGGTWAGRAYVYSGQTGTLLWTFTGGETYNWVGHSVSGAGDVDNDGYADLIVGAPRVGVNTGRAYVYSGQAGGLLWSFTGEAMHDHFGSYVSGAGDVNGDGYPDVIVGAMANDAGGYDAGRAYVYSGQTGGLLWAFTGEEAGDRFGGSVSGAGDVNGDGYNDVIVGAYLNDAGGFVAGRAYVYSGQTGGLLWTFTGEEAGDWFGGSVSGAGDVNADGYPDLIVGARLNDAGGGRAYVYSGQTGGLLRTFTGESGSKFGSSVSGTRDVDNDGYADLIIGAERTRVTRGPWRTNPGRAYVYSCAPPVITIERAIMVSPDELGVDLEVIVPSAFDPNESRLFVYLSAEVNGQFVDREFDITGLFDRGERRKLISFNYGDHEGFDPRVLDFSAANVPRFESNQEFALIAEAYISDGLTSEPDTQQVEIVLPVIIVHGYMGPKIFDEILGRVVGPAVYDALTNYLRDQTRGDFITGYTTDDDWYKTLWLEYYRSRSLTPDQAEAWLEAIVESACEGTYADRVNLVCHSLGGLIGRYYSSQSHSPRSHKVIMIGTPNYGSSMFYKGTSEWSLGEVTKVLNQQPLARWLIPNRCLYEHGEFDCLHDPTGEIIMPDLDVVRPEVDWEYPEEFGDEFFSPDGVTYYSIFGTAGATPDDLIVEERTGNTGTWYEVVDWEWVSGDSVVPAHSAELPSAVSINLPIDTPHALLPMDINVQIEVLNALRQEEEVGKNNSSNENVLHKPVSIPESYIPNQNYPNPFNAQTTIRYALPEAADIEISIYNLLGQNVATLLDRPQQAGEHTITWDATDFPSGVYFYRIEAGEFAETRKMVLLK